MNTGIGDAVNLAWKLAAVLQGRADAALLDTYEPERIAFARRLVATTDRAFTAVTSPAPLARFVRIGVVPAAAAAAASRLTSCAASCSAPSRRSRSTTAAARSSEGRAGKRRTPATGCPGSRRRHRQLRAARLARLAGPRLRRALRRPRRHLRPARARPQRLPLVGRDAGGGVASRRHLSRPSRRLCRPRRPGGRRGQARGLPRKARLAPSGEPVSFGLRRGRKARPPPGSPRSPARRKGLAYIAQGADSPLPACGERVRPPAERAERSEAGVRGRCRKRRPSAAAAPPSAPPPHPRLLRRLAAFGSPLPAGGER